MHTGPGLAANRRVTAVGSTSVPTAVRAGLSSGDACTAESSSPVGWNRIQIEMTDLAALTERLQKAA